MLLRQLCIVKTLLPSVLPSSPTQSLSSLQEVKKKKWQQKAPQIRSVHVFFGYCGLKQVQNCLYDWAVPLCSSLISLRMKKDHLSCSCRYINQSSTSLWFPYNNIHPINSILHYHLSISLFFVCSQLFGSSAANIAQCDVTDPNWFFSDRTLFLSLFLLFKCSAFRTSSLFKVNILFAIQQCSHSFSSSLLLFSSFLPLTGNFERNLLQFRRWWLVFSPQVLSRHTAILCECYVSTCSAVWLIYWMLNCVCWFFALGLAWPCSFYMSWFWRQRKLQSETKCIDRSVVKSFSSSPIHSQVYNNSSLFLCTEIVGYCWLQLSNVTEKKHQKNLNKSTKINLQKKHIYIYINTEKKGGSWRRVRSSGADVESTITWPNELELKLSSAITMFISVTPFSIVKTKELLMLIYLIWLPSVITVWI